MDVETDFGLEQWDGTYGAMEGETVRGVVDHIFFSSPRFVAGRLKCPTTTRMGDNHRFVGMIPFAGKIHVDVGQAVTLAGKWATHKKYGKQFEAKAIIRDDSLSLDADGLANYLAKCPAFVGIGPARARAIARAHGADFDRLLIESPSTIAHTAGVPIATIEDLRDEWMRRQATNAAASRLARWDLSYHQIETLIKALGNDAVNIVERNPYVLCETIKGLGFKRVDKMARTIGFPKDHPERIDHGILHVMVEALDAGHCWTEEGDLIEASNTLLVMDELDSREIITTRLEALMSSGFVHGELGGGRWMISAPAIHRAEREILKALRAMKEAGTISVISGAAGTGKTTRIKGILETMRDEGRDTERVILCAPTGKAAKRLEAVTSHRAMTIHRMLGYDGTNYTKGVEDPIDADTIIVDEFSMVDVLLFWRLLRALRPDTSLLLVGDHHQLPPVGAGNILRDLIDTNAVRTLILDVVHRAAGPLLDNCTAVLSGTVAPSMRPDDSHPIPPWVVMHEADAEIIPDIIRGIFHRAAQLGTPWESIQVLTSRHDGPIGTLALNIALQAYVQRTAYGRIVATPAKGRRQSFEVGDRVMQTKNDYGIDVMNGATGIIREITPGVSMVVEFEGASAPVELDTDAARNIQHAFAMTVHKAQGSEYPFVIFICHKSHAFQHHRNLFYTAVTRAQHGAIIVGDAWGIRHCAEVIKQDHRRTHLAEWLRGGVA